MVYLGGAFLLRAAIPWLMKEIITREKSFSRFAFPTQFPNIQVFHFLYFLLLRRSWVQIDLLWILHCSQRFKFCGGIVLGFAGTAWSMYLVCWNGIHHLLREGSRLVRSPTLHRVFLQLVGISVPQAIPATEVSIKKSALEISISTTTYLPRPEADYGINTLHFQTCLKEQMCYVMLAEQFRWTNAVANVSGSRNSLSIRWKAVYFECISAVFHKFSNCSDFKRMRVLLRESSPSRPLRLTAAVASCV